MNGGPAPPYVIQDAMQGQWVVPNILATAGQTFLAYAAANGAYRVARFTTLGDEIAFSLSIQEIDDHDVAALCETLTGKVLTVFTRHALNMLVNWRRFDPSDNSWTTLATVVTSDFATYSQLHRLAGVARIWLMYRVGSSSSGNWAIRYTDDEGATWSAEVTLAPNTYLTSSKDPDGVNIRCYAYDHPINGTDHDIYYFRVNLSTGDVTDSAGTVFGNVVSGTSLPIAKGEQHKAADVTDPTITRLYESGKTGAAAFLGSEFTTEMESTYYRYSYNGTTALFTRQAITTSGPAFVTATDYFGGAAFDENDLNIVYCARNLGVTLGHGSWELVRMKTVDSGASWQRDAVLRTTSNIIARPQVKAGRVWWCEAGKYVDFNNFSAGLCSTPV